jgi:hypothetical protein
MVRDDESQLRAGAIALYEHVPLVTTMVNLSARAFAFGGATLRRFDFRGPQALETSSRIEESLLERAAIAWCVHGYADLSLSVGRDGAITATEDAEAGESVVLQTREPRGPGTDGLPLLWTVSINAQVLLDGRLLAMAPELAENLIRFMGLEPRMVRLQDVSTADVNALSFALFYFESAVEDLRREFSFELARQCDRLLDAPDLMVHAEVAWNQPLVLRDSVVTHGPAVKVFASCGIPLEQFAQTKLNHARMLADSRLISQEQAREAEMWFS